MCTKPLQSLETVSWEPGTRHPWLPAFCHKLTLTILSLGLSFPSCKMGAAAILWPRDVKPRLIGKDLDAGKDWRQKKKRVAEDEMVG